MTSQEREVALKFARRVYGSMKLARPYALNKDADVVLSAIARAVLERVKNSDSGWNAERAEKEMQRVIEHLAKAGCNVLQNRPGDAPKLPSVWRHPITNEPLPPPTTMEEKNVLQARDPELLRWFEDMEKSPYATVAKYRDDEAQRSSLAAIEYNAETHTANPFCGDNRTAQSELTGRDPQLGAFYQRESQPVEIKIFSGKSQNLTHRSLLAKDPEIGAVIATAEKIHAQWKMEDRAAAEQAAKEAAETLRKLQAETEREGKSQLRIA